MRLLQDWFKLFFVSISAVIQVVSISICVLLCDWMKQLCSSPWSITVQCFFNFHLLLLAIQHLLGRCAWRWFGFTAEVPLLIIASVETLIDESLQGQQARLNERFYQTVAMGKCHWLLHKIALFVVFHFQLVTTSPSLTLVGVYPVNWSIRACLVIYILPFLRLTTLHHLSR